MAATGDYFSSRPTLRTRPSPTVRSATAIATSPRSPRTPLLGRSISSQFGSPGSYRTEQEDTIIYELSPRCLTAGYAGESRPRCRIPFTPDSGRRAGDYRPYSSAYLQQSRRLHLGDGEAAGHELYGSDLSSLDIGLVEDRLDRALRIVQSDHLQLDSKPRKAVLVVQPLLPTPLIEVVLKVLFSHYTQPPSVAILTCPVLNCVGAGVRSALVVDVGWEETVVTAIGEYKEVSQRRSIRAGRLLTERMANIIEHEARRQSDQDSANVAMTFGEADALTQRMAWCRADSADSKSDGSVQLVTPGSDPPTHFLMPYNEIAEAAEQTYFPIDKKPSEYDEHELPLDMLAYRVLLALDFDLRATCLNQIILTGSSSNVPGLKRRLLQEIRQAVNLQGWSKIRNFGSAKRKPQQVLPEQPAKISSLSQPPSQTETSSNLPLSLTKMPIQDSIPHAHRVHDDIQDPITLKAERESNKSKEHVGIDSIRGVDTLGAWAGASLMVSMRVKGAYEIDRDEFVKHGLRGISFHGI